MQTAPGTMNPVLSAIAALLLAASLPLGAASPFWETTDPAQWTDEQLQQLLRQSPWAQLQATDMPAAGRSRNKLSLDPVQFFLASAGPIVLAEKETRRRGAPVEDPLLDEYFDFLRDNRSRYIVLAVRVARPDLLTETETRAMEDKSLLRVGRRSFRMVGHFPPTRFDPYLRLVFPREVTSSDASLRFELYLPGVPKPLRQVEFAIKDLIFRGQPEM